LFLIRVQHNIDFAQDLFLISIYVFLARLSRMPCVCFASVPSQIQISFICNFIFSVQSPTQPHRLVMNIIYKIAILVMYTNLVKIQLFMSFAPECLQSCHMFVHDLLCQLYIYICCYTHA